MPPRNTTRKPATSSKPAATKPAASNASKNGDNSIVLFFDEDRETKGTFRFQEDHEEGTRPVMGTVWLRKDMYEKLGVAETKAIRMTIEADTDSER